MYRIVIIVLFVFIRTSFPIYSQNLYPQDTVMKMELVFPQTDFWEQLKQNYESETDIPARLIVNDNTVVDSVGVRFKGYSSYNAATDKKPFNISIDAYKKDQRIWGYKTLNLNNIYADPTYVREKIANEIFMDYIPSLQSSYITLYINGEFWGLYLNVEQVNKDFYSKWFNNNEGNAYKGDPKGDLIWHFNDTIDYKNRYEKKTNEDSDDWSDLIHLIDILNNSETIEDSLTPIFNIDRALWYIALCNIFVNLDSYIYSLHNYYLYHCSLTNQFNIIPWDMNETFGCFPPNLSMQKKIEYPVINIGILNTPVLIQKLIEIPKYRLKYLAHYKTILSEFFHKDTIETLVNKWQNLIENYVKIDSKSLYKYEDFKNNLYNDVVYYMRQFPGLLSLVNNRSNFLNNKPEFKKPQPSIINVSHSPDNPKTDDILNFRANITDIKGIKKAELYYKYDYELFQSNQMFDDGQHNDESANDGIYGCSLEIPKSKNGKTLYYYIIAQNIDSAYKFMPERAEFVLYSVQIQKDTSLIPLLINEFMADNETTITDPQGEYEDWVEIYNYGDEPIDLNGMFLTDNPQNPTKWEFPDTTIKSNGYMLVWADEDDNEEPGLHCNFKLSKNGEYVGIYNKIEENNELIDGYTFATQETDISEGRYPNGSGNFCLMTKPTPNAENEMENSVLDYSNYNKSLYTIKGYVSPNPVKEYSILYYQTMIDDNIEIELYSSKGFKIETLQNQFTGKGNHSIVINTTNLVSGFYFYIISGKSGYYINKFIVIK